MGDTSTTPAYGQLTVSVGKEQFVSPIGTHGQFHFENLPPGRHQALLEYNGISCGLTIVIPESESPVVEQRLPSLVHGASFVVPEHPSGAC